MDDVSRVQVDGLAVSDALRASSFVSGAPVVRVDLTLLTLGQTSHAGSLSKPARRTMDDESAAAATGAAPDGERDVAAAAAVPTPARLPAGVAVTPPRKDPYYEKWAAFDEEAE